MAQSREYNWRATWKSSDSGLESREIRRGDPLRSPRDILYPQNLTLTSPTSGGCSVGTVRSRTLFTSLGDGREAPTVLGTSDWG
jgi:hypothetical protein